MNSISKRIPFFFTLFLLSACAKQNAGIVKQSYHDLTSHYNGYFNANEQFNTQIKSLSAGYINNYDEILSLNSYGNLADFKDQNESLNTTIEKARLSIQTHQEKQQGKNYQANEDNSISNWSDDAFLLIGKAYYFQGELDSSINCFRYITAHFDEAVDGRSKEKIKKQRNSKKKKAKDKKDKKKLIEKELAGKDIRPHKKIGLHESAKSEALVWLSNAYVSNEQFIEAEAIITYIRGNQTFLSNYDTELELSNANLYLAQESYNTGLPFLESAIDQTKKQKNKGRLQFIAAQINEKLGQKDKAAEYYQQSMKGNADFEMVFYAKLKLIKMYSQNPSSESEALRLIAKMTKDNKNKAYLDQLFYEKAMIALNNDEREDAKKFLIKSAVLSSTNTKQKGISFSKLGDMNYEEEDYPLAQAYYDSSMNFLDESFLRYDIVSNRSNVLTDLIDYLTTIRLNDSLLVLGNIPAKKLESLLYKQAVDIVDAEVKQEKKNQQTSMISSTEPGNKGSKNGWYFYSEASKNSGYKKFKQTWGEIELEDDWRRSNKNNSFDSADTEDDLDEQDEYFARIDAQYEEMLSAIPSSEKEKKSLKKDIVEAYYNGAVIYKIGLTNLPKSIEMFEKLNQLYPNNKYEPEALYQLYVLFSELESSSLAEAAKSELLSKYPDDKFTAYLKNPNADQEKNIDVQAADFYAQSYALYEVENFDEVILQCEQANELFPKVPLVAKFDLLKAMAIGGKKLYDPFIASLEYVVENHANTEEQEKAEELLSFFNVNSNIKKSAPTDKLMGDKKINIDSPKTNQTLNQKNFSSSSSTDGLKIKLGNKDVLFGGKKNGDDPLKKEE